MTKVFVFSVMLFISVSVNAQSNEVENRVNELKALMIDPDEKKLTEILSSDLSYGHSSGKVEDRAAFIGSLTAGDSDFIDIELSDLTIQVNDNVAIVRHKLTANTNDKGKGPGTVKLGILLVWKKEGKQWKLLARQAFKL